MLDADAILYYADHPVEFTEDVIRARPDPEQAKILRSVAANPMTTVRSGHGGHLVYMHAPIPQNPMHGTDAAPAIRHLVGGGQQVDKKQQGPRQ